MLRLWGRLSSINVRKVVWTAQELGIALQRTDAGGQFGIVREPHYLSLNPNGLVPLLEDDDTGVVLWESNAIVRYLCAHYAPGDLYPADLRQRFEAEQWMDWQQTTLNPAGRDAFIQWIRTSEAERQPGLIRASVTATEALMDVLDGHLARRAYLAGERFTMADIPVACEIHRWRGLPLIHPLRPHLDRWYQAVFSRPAARGVLDAPLS